MKFAAIDIGTNAVRLLLTNVIQNGKQPIFKKEALVRMPLRLGDDAFRDQLSRSALWIASNIAEGYGRGRNEKVSSF